MHNFLAPPGGASTKLPSRPSPHCGSPSLMGGSANAATVVPPARKTTAHLTVKTTAKLTLQQQQSATEGLSRRVRSTRAPACCGSVVLCRHSSHGFIQNHRRSAVLHLLRLQGHSRCSSSTSCGTQPSLSRKPHLALLPELQDGLAFHFDLRPVRRSKLPPLHSLFPPRQHAPRSSTVYCGDVCLLVAAHGAHLQLSELILDRHIGWNRHAQTQRPLHRSPRLLLHAALLHTAGADLYRATVPLQ